jgi:hypothetical protein
LADELAPLLGLTNNEDKSSLDDLVARTPHEIQSRRPDPGLRDFGRPPSQRESHGVEMSGSRPIISKATSPRERAAEECFVWWLWNWDMLRPAGDEEWRRRIELFEGSEAEGALKELYNRGRSDAVTPGIEFWQAWLERTDVDPVFRRWIVKGLVAPDVANEDDTTKVLNSFTELATHLNRERIRAEISRLQNELRGTKGDETETAQILQRVQNLRMSLEKRK